MSTYLNDSPEERADRRPRRRQWVVTMSSMLTDDELRRRIFDLMACKRIGAVYGPTGWVWPVDVRIGSRSLLENTLDALLAGRPTYPDPKVAPK